MSESEERGICAQPGADASWWLEPDIDPADFGEERGNNRSLDTEYGKALQVARQDLTRGKILCYSCPLLASCRADSWDEPANIFAGLDANERFTARQKGQVQIGSKYVYRSVRNRNNLRQIVVERFVAGSSVTEIAATLGCNTEQVWYQIKGHLASERVNWEETLCQTTPPPTLPARTARSSFRLGALTRDHWATQSPSGRDSSSDSGTRTQTAA